MNRNLLMEYASYQLKNKFEPRIKKKLFYKLMYLLNEELRDTDSDIKLPYYWYRFGTVVYKDDYYFNIEYKIDFSRISREVKSAINQKIDIMFNQFRPMPTEDINTIVYTNAHFEFQREFRNLIMLTNLWTEGGTIHKDFDSEKFDPIRCLDNLIINFPETEFQDFFVYFLEWENIVRYMFKYYPDEKNEIKDLITSFSIFFTKKLRVLENENIPSKQVNKWLKDFNVEDVPKFREFMSKKSSNFYSTYYTPTGKNQEFVKELQELSANIVRE